MEKLTHYLLQFGNLNQQQLDFIISRCTRIELAKDQYFSEAGKIARQIAFVNKGILRICYFDKNAEEITRYFIAENNFTVDLNSYNSQIPASEYIQAVTDCELFVLSKGDMQELSMTVIGWDDIINKITSKALMQKVNLISPMIAEDATERYLAFMKKFPALVNRIPLSYIASYLGITQSSLSRIRKNI